MMSQNDDICWMKWYARHLITYQTLKLRLLDILKCLLYIIGYVTINYFPTEEEIFNNTSFYFQEYRHFFKEIDSGNLKISQLSGCFLSV